MAGEAEDFSKPTAVKRKVPDSLRFGDDSDEEEAGAGKGAEEKKLKTTFDSESFKCSICLNIWHDVVCVSPCQHNFCNACFSTWYKRAGSGGCKCPQCRGDIMFACKNHAMASLVEDLLTNNPSLKRTPEEIKEMDKNAIVKSTFMKLGQPPAPAATSYGGGRSLSYSGGRPLTIRPSQIIDDDDEDDDGRLNDDEAEESDAEGDEEEISCRQCSANSSTFRCQPGSSHLTCSSCFCDMPERTDLDVPQKCIACDAVYCDAYWRSQNLPSDSGEVGCPNGRLQSMSERQLTNLPTEAHNKNRFEQEFTKQYLTQRGFTIEGVVRDWLAKVERSECDLPSGMQITSASKICNKCSDRVTIHLMDKFRMSVPKTDMPAEAAGRDDCWYGYACRTQRHNPNHAKKLNHMCEPTHRNVNR